MIDKLLPTVGVRWVIGLLIIAGLCAWCFFHGYVAGREKLDEYIGKQAVAAQQIMERQAKVTRVVVTKYLEREAETKAAESDVKMEVIQYAETNPDGTCLDPEWRRLHDRAATGEIPRTAVRTDDPSGAPTAAAALATVEANYFACHRTANRLNALQEWVREQHRVTAQ